MDFMEGGRVRLLAAPDDGIARIAVGMCEQDESVAEELRYSDTEQLLEPAGATAMFQKLGDLAADRRSVHAPDAARSLVEAYRQVGVSDPYHSEEIAAALAHVVHDRFTPEARA